MIEYDCGCTSKGLLVLDGTPTMLIAVEEWNKTDKSKCFYCFYESTKTEGKTMKAKKMSYLLLSADYCPSCGKGTYWKTGFDYETYERVYFCDSCDYEERRFDKESKETFEFLLKNHDKAKKVMIVEDDE